MVALDTLKARMISALVLLIPKFGKDAEFIDATYASKVGIAGVLLYKAIAYRLYRYQYRYRFYRLYRYNRYADLEIYRYNRYVDLEIPINRYFVPEISE